MRPSPAASFRASRLFGGLLVSLVAFGAIPEGRGQDVTGRNLILTGSYDGTTLQSANFINQTVGAGIFYDAGYFGSHTVIANVEGGHIWGGHEVFDRSAYPDAPAAPGVFINGPSNPDTAPNLGETDYHATMVGNILAGTGDAGDGNLAYLGVGMAPFANLWSGAVATSFDQTDIGTFSTDKASFLVPYKTFFNGEIGGRKADVINSSWGYDDPAGTDEYTRIVDGLARQNPTVTMVVSAGNSGPEAGTVGGFGTGYNLISVGSLGGATDADPFMTPSTFSSSGPGDFYNPQTGQTIPGVRATVHLSAPGEGFALAYYGGPTGSLATTADPAQAAATDLYLTNENGTSFAAPVVAGGVALLKDLSYGGVYPIDTDQARDSRVIRSVLMAGATATHGWNNGQTTVDGVVSTSQSLDYLTGAGRLDLTRAAQIYVFGTSDVPGLLGGDILATGWDFGSVALHASNSYLFDQAFAGDVELTISLNWFVGRSFDNATDNASDNNFADLNLEVWSITDGVWDHLVAQSDSLYNNSEFLRFMLPSAGRYGVRVTFDDFIYDLDPTHSQTQEEYGLAWSTVPESSTWALLLAGAAVLFLFRRRGMAQ